MKLYYHPFAKFMAGLLAIASLTACTLSLICINTLSRYNSYDADSTGQSLVEDLYYEDILTDMNAASDYYSLLLVNEPWTKDIISEYEAAFSGEKTNFFFTISDFDTGEILLKNYQDDYAAYVRRDYFVTPANYFDHYSEYYYTEYNDSYVDHFGNEIDSQSVIPAAEALEDAEPVHIMMVGHVRKDLNQIPADKYAAAANVAYFLYTNRFTFLICAAISALLFLNFLIFLLYGAGRHKDSNEVYLRLADRVPLDVFLLLMGGLGSLGASLFYAGFRSTLYTVPTKDSLITWGLFVLGANTLLVLILNSIAVRVRAKTLWQNTLLRRFLVLFRRPARYLGQLFLRLPAIWRTLLLCCVFLGAEVFAVSQVYWLGSFVPVVILTVVLLFVILSSAIHFNQLRKGCFAIADGDLDYRVDTSYMPSDFRAHGEALNRIGAGISGAVEERLKSELFKTELITNVSHDLKTPLTSIVNYVDLLSKTDLPEDARSYLEVLQRQSHRLRKLTEDLVEASKASTGNLPVDIVPIALGELVGQVAGEYEDRFARAQLIPVLQMPDAPVTVLGDGRYLWRILDNLLSNVCKYALAGTRVYMFASVEENTVVITVKNISRDALSTTPEQLMERFVRGDASRNTEGSGLGLSIASSLAELMNGKLTLSIDGDLFKAELRMPAAPTPEIEPTEPAP